MANVWTSKGATDTLHEVDPISRIEGHLGVKVSVGADNVITDANAHGNLWRGFENFLLGRDINDAITFVQRICGVCPVPHGMTSTYAVDAVLGYSKGHITFATATETDGTFGVPEKAVLIRNLVMACDSIMSSITHFYHLAAPSYIQGPAMAPWTPYFDNSYYHAALLNPGGNTYVPRLDNVHLWDAVILSYVKALRVRRLVFEAGSLFAGRMPMTSCYVGGGVSNDGQENLTARVDRFRTIMTEVGKFVINEYVPIALALGYLYPKFDSQPLNGANMADVNHSRRGFGAGLGRFLAWGGFPNLDGTLGSAGGVFDATADAVSGEDVLHFKVSNKADVYNKFLSGAFSVPTNLTEDIAHSRYQVDALDADVYDGTAAYPGDVSRTHPKRSNGYTYIKAPRWAGKPCEVGPFARLVVAGVYPVDGSTLASTIPGYKELYTVDGFGGGGLNTAIIADAIIAGLNADGVTGAVATFVLGLTGGLSTLDRLRARALETLVLIQKVLGAAGRNDGAGDPAARVTFSGDCWLNQLAARTGNPSLDTAGSTWRKIDLPTGERQGWGANEAARGALMHQATIKGGKITKYQCIVPTTWNGSPKDSLGQRGAMEESMIGTTFAPDGASFTNQAGSSITTAGGVEVLRHAQSFDPCIACAIH